MLCSPWEGSLGPFKEAACSFTPWHLWSLYTLCLQCLPIFFLPPLALLHLVEHLFFPDCVRGSLFPLMFCWAFQMQGHLYCLCWSSCIFGSVSSEFHSWSSCLPEVDLSQQDAYPGQVFVMAQPDTMQMLNKRVAEKVERGLWRSPCPPP